MNIRKFLDDYNISYTLDAPNLKKGNIGINCPFHNDVDYYGAFIVDTNSVGYNCWLCGGFPLKEVLQALSGTKDVHRILKEYKGSNRARKVQSRVKTHNTKIDIPGGELKVYHKNYLKERNFDPEFLRLKYDLRGTYYEGRYPYRIIIPIYYKNKIISFQGRDFTNKQELRYKACREDDEIIHHKDILFNLDNCKSRKGIMCEGLFDVFRLGDNSFATFGTSLTNSQLCVLKEYFDKIYILFDNEEKALKKAESYADKITSIGIEVEMIETDINRDPGDFTEDEVLELKIMLGLL